MKSIIKFVSVAEANEWIMDNDHNFEVKEIQCTEKAIFIIFEVDSGKVV